MGAFLISGGIFNKLNERFWGKGGPGSFEIFY
jgi:hypothetical protein